MNHRSIGNKISTGMLALVTALSFSFADYALVFADDELPVEEPAIEQIEEQSVQQIEEENTETTGDQEESTEEPIVEPVEEQPEKPVIDPVISETPSRGLVDSVSSSNGWYYAEDGTTLANVRELAKQGPTSYNVLQGSCSNGKKYFYFAFMKKATTKVKIIRMKLNNGELKYSKSSGVIDNYHGNGVTYVKDANGKGKILITNYWSGHTRFTVLDANTMKVDGEIISTYWKKAERKNCEIIYADGTDEEDQLSLKDYIDAYGKYGFSGVAYDEKNNRVVASIQTIHDLIVFDLVTNEDGSLSLVPRKYIVEDREESTIQDIDCDENYIYMTWSAGNGIAGNRICVYDWNGNNVKNYVADQSYEMEGLFHTGSGDNAQFYATYHHSYLYDKVTYTKKKVKWKKVWNKKHTKKIWKYKTKKVKKVTTYIYRNGYLRNLGNLTTS